MTGVQTCALPISPGRQGGDVTLHLFWPQNLQACGHRREERFCLAQQQEGRRGPTTGTEPHAGSTAGEKMGNQTRRPPNQRFYPATATNVGSCLSKDDSKASSRQATPTHPGHRGGAAHALRPCGGPARGASALLTLALRTEVSRGRKPQLRPPEHTGRPSVRSATLLPLLALARGVRAPGQGTQH